METKTFTFRLGKIPTTDEDHEATMHLRGFEAYVITGHTKFNNYKEIFAVTLEKSDAKRLALIFREDYGAEDVLIEVRNLGEEGLTKEGFAYNPKDFEEP